METLPINFYTQEDDWVSKLTIRPSYNPIRYDCRYCDKTKRCSYYNKECSGKCKIFFERSLSYTDKGQN